MTPRSSGCERCVHSFPWRRGGWLVAPLIAGLLVTLVYPTLATLAFAVTRSTLARPFQRFLGLDNFASLLGGDYPAELARTVLFVVPTAASQLVIGVALALVLRRVTVAGGLARSVLLLPLLTPPVMAGIAWKLLLASEGGFVNATLVRLGVTQDAVRFLASPQWAWVWLAIADTWQWTPFVALLCHAALLGVPADAEEAAVLDGASPWQVVRHVVLPLIAPALASILLLRVVIGFKLFDLVYVLTFGGPGDATMFASFRIWRTALQSYDVGLAAAQVVLFALVVSLATWPISRLARRSP